MKKLLYTVIAILGFANLTIAQVPSYVPTDSLKGWWGFNGNANDLSGNGNNGTVNGASLTTDRFGASNSSYDFNGTTNYISINDNQTFKFSSHSISFWYFRVNNPLAQGNPCANSGNELLISKGRDIDTNTFFISHTNSGGLSQVYKLMTGSRVIRDKIILGSWTNVISTFDSVSQTSKSYVNGILDSTISSIRWSSKGNNSPLTFGVHSVQSNGCTYYYKGKLDDIGIWNRALTQQEINNLYNGNICYKTISVTDTLIINVKRTSLNPLAYTNTIKVYPNPTKDKITIDNGDLSKMTGYSIKIYNSIGQQLFQSNITQQQFSLDITQWGSNGIYFMELKDNNGNIVDVKKIVLQ